MKARSTVTSVQMSLGKRIGRDRYLLLMALPCVVFILVFRYIPMYGVILAFKRFDISKVFGSQWVGLYYFRLFFSSSSAWTVIRNTFVLNIWDVVFGFPAPIIFALLLNELRSTSFRRTTQIVSYMPHFISVVIIASLAYLALSPSTGFINHMIARLGLKPVYFMIEPAWFRPIYIGTGIWQEVGWGSIIYMAAIAGISPDMYEAAVMDGASRWQQTFRITLPTIMPTIIILLIFRMGSLLASGTEKVLLLYNPLTYNVSDVLGTYLYRVGLMNANYSLGTAIGLANSIVSLFLIVISNWIAKRVSEIGIW
jgi:putative aldouronate transport system permease protein